MFRCAIQVAIAATTLIACYVLIKSLLYIDNSKTGSISDVYIELPPGICLKRYEDMGNMVWSHRAAARAESPAGSHQSVNKLLLSGITHFDIDISIDGDVGFNDSMFIVAHPSFFLRKNIESESAKPQTLKAFLTQVYEFCCKTTPVIGTLVTLEPKFSDENALRAFVKVVADAKLSNNCAIILRAENDVKIVSEISSLTVAIPLRTSGLIPGEFWNPETSELKLSNYTGRSVLMPDIKLFRTIPNLVQRFGYSENIGWIVDNIADLKLALDNGATGIYNYFPRHILIMRT